MHQLIDKKKNRILVYLILLLALSSISSKTLLHKKAYSISIEKINISGLSQRTNLKILDKLNKFFSKSIFIINKEKINQVFSEYNIIEEYNIKRIYPSSLEIQIKPTSFVAKISSNRKLLVGNNGKLILDETNDKILPYIFGEFNSKEFLKLKKNIDKSKFNFNDFKSLFFFPSNRWDILTINNVLIKLPDNNLLASLNFADKIIKDNQFEDNKIIDLRIIRQLIVK